MIPPHANMPRTRPAPVALRNVRPVEPYQRPTNRPAATVDPTLARIARTGQGYTTARIDGRPVIVYIERDRLRWGKLAALVAAIITPIMAVVLVAAYVIGTAVAWLAAHWLLIVGILVTTAAAPVILRALASIGVCCPGLHCAGCRHG